MRTDCKHASRLNIFREPTPQISNVDYTIEKLNDKALNVNENGCMAVLFFSKSTFESRIPFILTHPVYS